MSVALAAVLAVGVAACSMVRPAVPTLMPTAQVPRTGMLQTSPTNGHNGVPATWTPTRPAEQVFVTAAPLVLATQYQRTPTPTMPTWTPSCTPTSSATPTRSATPTSTATPTPWPTIAPEEVWTLDRYPRPPADNGWGMHWFPTYQQEINTINRYVIELQRMHIRWLVLLNDGTDIGRNDYLVQRLANVGIMPVMRLYVHGVVSYDGNLAAAVHHYRSLGVHYFQLYNEPNLNAEAAGRVPNPDWYVTHWAEAAEIVVANGGLPGFGALSPGGEYEDLAYLRSALQSLKRRKQGHLLNQGWISIHNYAQYQPVDSTLGFMRFRLVDQIVLEELGRSLPILGTEGGHYGDLAEQYLHVRQQYQYLSQREPYLFCHSYWLLGNRAGGGWDSTFEYQALFRADGTVNPLVAGLFYRGP